MAQLHQLVDEFQALDPARWQFLSTRSQITAGRLAILPGYIDPADENTSTARFGSEVWSVGSWDMRDSGLAAEVVHANGSASGVTELGVFTSSPRTNALLWLVRFDSSPDSAWGWELSAVRRTAGVETVVATLRVDPQEYRWLSITEDAGVVTWATSPDGFTWHAAGQAATPWDVSAVRVALGTWYGSPGDTQDTALFDSLNLDLTAGDPVTITGEAGDPYLAVDVQPDNQTGTFRLGVSQLGGPDRLAWSSDDPGAWTNVVCDVRAVHYRRGASRQQGVLTRTEAGMASITVLDVRSLFDPNLNGNTIHKGTPVRLRAWGTRTDGSRWDAVLFTGELGVVDAAYTPAEEHPVVTLEAVDVVGPLVAWESEGLEEPGAGDGDTLLQRAQRFMELVGRGEASSASSATYAAPLARTLLQQPWEELTAAADAELGRLWVDRHNRLVTRSRGSLPSGPVRGTLSDVHGEAPLGVHCCVADATMQLGGVLNRARAGRERLPGEEGTAVQVRLDDEASQQQYGVSTVSRMSLPLQSDAQLEPWAGSVIVARTRPELRVESVQPQPAPSDLDAALEAWPAVLQTDLDDRWLFLYHPAVGPPVIRGLGVVGIELDVTPEGWMVRWTTEPAAVPGAENPTGWFTLGMSTLGGPDLLAPY